MSSWESPDGFQQGPGAYEQERTRKKSRLTVLLFPSGKDGQKFDEVPVQAVRTPSGGWLAKIAPSLVRTRLPDNSVLNVADDEEITTLYVPLTKGGHIVQEGQELPLKRMRIRKADGTFEVRKVTVPIVIGALAALSIGVAAVVKQRRK